MSVVNTGTTNTDGTGSASNLDKASAASTLTDSGILSTSDALLENIEFSDDSSTTIVKAETWNGANTKEVQVNNDSDIVITDNFVDVDIDNGNDEGATIIVTNSKRGNIDTSDGDDTIDISVYSNNDLWSNTFNINTNGGDDSVTLSNSLNSQYTSFNIDAGEGNDTVDVSALSNPASDSVVRTVDGGEGIDTLIYSGDNTVSFENCEVVIGGEDASLTVDSDLLANNDATDETGFGLVLSDIDVSFDDDVASYDVAASLTADESSYLTSLGLDADDYSSVTVTTDDGDAYHILTNDTDFDSSAAA